MPWVDEQYPTVVLPLPATTNMLDLISTWAQERKLSVGMANQWEGKSDPDFGILIAFFTQKKEWIAVLTSDLTDYINQRTSK